MTCKSQELPSSKLTVDRSNMAATECHAIHIFLPPQTDSLHTIQLLFKWVLITPPEVCIGYIHTVTIIMIQPRNYVWPRLYSCVPSKVGHV